jgi:hypothetical protein
MSAKISFNVFIGINTYKTTSQGKEHITVQTFRLLATLFTLSLLNQKYLYLVVGDVLADVLADVEVDLAHLLHVKVVGHNHVEALQQTKNKHVSC